MLIEYYNAARHGAALAEMDWFGVLKLTGSERVSWLQGMVTNDVQKLAPGTGCYAAHLTAQGKIVAHMLYLRELRGGPANANSGGRRRRYTEQGWPVGPTLKIYVKDSRNRCYW